MVLKDTIANSIISLEEAIETLNEGEGEESVQIGARANASGSKTVSIGADSLATYSGSVALGVSASAEQHGSIAIGSGSSIYQDNRYWYGGSIAIGEKAKAGNMAAIGIGCDANAGQNGIAIGSGSYASYGAVVGVSSYANQYSVSIGNNSRAEGFYSVSVGQGSKTTDGSGVAIGNNSTIGAEYSVGVGQSTRIGRFSINSIAVGRGTTVGTSDFQYSTGSIAIGAQSTVANRAPLNTLLGTQSAIMTGSAYSIVLGPRSQVSGSNSIVIGNNLTSSKDNQGILGNDAVQWEVPGSMFVSGALSTIDPVLPENVATKAYVDSQSGGGGGGTPDRIESTSGDAFVETTDDYRGWGNPGSVMRAESSGASARMEATSEPNFQSRAEISVSPDDGIPSSGAGFQVVYRTPPSERYVLSAYGAPLTVVEPVENYHAATKGYVDSQLGGGDSSLLTSDDANTFITASNDSLITGFDQYSKKLVVEELSPEDPGIMLSKSIETWDDIAHDEAIWGSVDGLGKAFLRTNYAFVEDSNDKSWGFQWSNEVFEEYSHHGINITQGDTRLTFATVDTSSGDFYLASDTYGELGRDYGARIDIRKDNIEMRASKRVDYGFNETSFKIEPSGSSTNKPLSMGNNRITDVEDPMFLQDVATKAYVDARYVVEWWDPVWTLESNVNNVSNVECSYTRTYRAAGGSLVTLEGTIEVSPSGAGQCSVQVDLPVARVGTVQLAGTVLVMEFTLPGHAGAVALVDSTTLTLEFIAEDEVPHTVGFRASYRAA